jgi:uncharacterized protein (DUF1697 family)
VKYAAFLRGINVGGNRVLKMADVKAAFEAVGMREVKSILASGNIVFDSGLKDVKRMERTIEKQLEAKFQHDIGVFVRPMVEIEALVKADPFKGRTVTPQTRLYVMFLSEPPETRPKLPFKGPIGDLEILRISDGEVCAIMTVSDTVKTPDAMSFVAKTFGPKVTTRNWNTVLKVAKA